LCLSLLKPLNIINLANVTFSPSGTKSRLLRFWSTQAYQDEKDEDIDRRCWGKLLLKVMHYNIALLPKKKKNRVSYFLWKVIRYVTFALLSLIWAGLFLCLFL